MVHMSLVSHHLLYPHETYLPYKNVIDVTYIDVPYQTYKLITYLKYGQTVVLFIVNNNSKQGSEENKNFQRK